VVGVKCAKPEMATVLHLAPTDMVGQVDQVAQQPHQTKVHYDTTFGEQTQVDEVLADVEVPVGFK